MAKKEKKQKIVVSNERSVNYGIVVPDTAILSDQDLSLLHKSNAKKIFVLNHDTGTDLAFEFTELQSLSYESLNSLIQENDIENILILGNEKCNGYGITEAKKKSDSLKLIGANPSNSKAANGKLSRIVFELSTQLCTSIPEYGSHTKTAVIPRSTFLALVKKNGISVLQNFKTTCSRAADLETPFTSAGNFDQLSAEGAFKTVFQNIGFYFKEKVNFFVKEPLKAIKNKEESQGTHSPIFKLLLFALVVLSFIVIPILSFNYGATWDEKLHSDYGREVVEAFPDGWLDHSIYEKKIHAINTMTSYSASFDVISAFVHKIFPNMGIYELRHFINCFYGLFLFLFCALIAKEFGGWRAAFIAFLLVLFSPSFFGHIFNNPKDIPFATGFTMGLLYLIRYFKELPNPRLKTSIMLIIGIALAISIRPPGFILTAFFVMVLVVHWVIFVKGSLKKKLVLKYLKYFLTIGIISYGLGIILWPYGLEDPINNPIAAFKQLSNFVLLTAYQIFDGVRMYSKPWFYAPKYILITAPLIVLIGIPFGLFGFVKLKDKKQKWLLAFLLFSALFPVCYGIYKESYLYNGWRHFLFVYAPVVILSAIGFEMILRSLKGKIANYIVYGILALGIGKVALWQTQNHPFEYMYFNEIVGGTAGAAGDYETDYWCQTPKKAIEWLAQNELTGDKKVRIKSNNETNSLQYYANKYSDSIKIVWSREYEWQKEQWDYAIWTTRTLSKNQIENKDVWPPKGTIHTIDVDGFPMAAIVKRENDFAKRGIDAMGKNNLPLALEELKKAYAYDPNEEEVVRRIGLVYKAMNNFPEAIKYLKKARILRSENYEALEALGEIKLSQAERERQIGNTKGSTQLKEEAKAFFIETIKHKINYSSAYFYLGNIYLNDGYYIDAIANFDKFIERQPTLAQGHLLKARAQVALNSMKEAEETLLIGINNYGIKDKQMFLLLADVYRKQGNNQAAQQVMNQMPK